MSNVTNQADICKGDELYISLCSFIEDHYEGYSYQTDYHFEKIFAPAEGFPAPNENTVRRSSIHTSFDKDGDFEAIFSIFHHNPLHQAEPHPQTRAEQIEAHIKESERSETFRDCVLRIIAEKGLDEADVYHSVFMDRRLFNKIRNDPEYQPAKRTALLLAVALKLTLPETQELLGTAGYTLTHCNKRDLIVEFFILQGNYNIFEINEMLEHFNQPLLMKCE